MIRQTRSYLKGAVSGTALVAVAIVVFVALVSVQTLRDWPLAGLVGGSEAESTSVEDGAAQDVTAAGASGAAGAAGSGSDGAKSSGGGNGGGDGATTDPATGIVPGGGPQGPDAPVSSPGAGDGGSSPGGSGGRASNRGGGGGSGQPSPGGGGGQQPAGGGGDQKSPSETVTGTVNETVKGVDEATGGVLGETGVTKTTEEVVDGVAGPDSTVGKTVDDTVGKVKDTVGGVLGE